MTLYNKKKLTGVLYVTAAFVCASLIVGNVYASKFSQFISDNLGQKTSKTVQVDGDTTDTEYFKSDYSKLNDLIADETEYAKEVQAEGCVLLKKGGLPLSGNETVALLGKTSKDSVYHPGGSGSGSVNASRAPKIVDTFTKAGFKVNADVLAFYDGINVSTPEPDASSLPSYSSDVGIVFIGRIGGEGNDLSFDELTLTDAEKSLIDSSLAHCKKTIVLLNASNSIELGYLKDKDVAILWVGGSGEISTSNIPYILNGTINPSGKMVDVVSYSRFSAPATLNFGDWNLTNVDSSAVGNKYVNYAESIYYGYRYYETRYADKVMGTANVGEFNYSTQVQFPFGYGLSYTNFEYSNFSVKENVDSFDLSVTIKNSGAVAGKEAVGFYMQSPYTAYDKANGIEKSAIQLVDFGKTKKLNAGESDTISVHVSKEVMKAYDANKAKTYIVDDGDYYFSVGSDVHEALNNVLSSQGYTTGSGMTEAGDSSLASKYTQKGFDGETYSKSTQTGEKITNQFDKANLSYYKSGTKYLTRSNWTGTYPTQAADMEATAEMIKDLSYDVVSASDIKDDNGPMPTLGASNGLALASLISRNEDGSISKVDYDSEYWDKLIEQMSAEELMDLYAMGGYMTIAIPSIGKPASIDMDGPATLGGTLMGGNSTFAYPAESLLASTWNKDLVAKMGYYVGEDGLMTGITGWYAPGMNIHRTAVAGRNFEYYSEDPIQSGIFSSLVTKEAQKKGIVVYAKHFALNEQETNRSTACTFATEQAIREIYLKPFEIAVTDGGAKGIMNSMNRIGMVWAGAHEGLLTEVCRNEWDFKGVMITDATLAQSNKMRPLPSLLAGNDLYLCTNKGIFNIDGYASSPTVIKALKVAAKRIVYSFADSSVMNGISANTKIVPVTPAWQIWLYVVDGVVGAAAVAGLTVMTVFLVKSIKKEKEA